MKLTISLVMALAGNSYAGVTSDSHPGPTAGVDYIINDVTCAKSTLRIDDPTLVIECDINKVGIGTTAPATLLEIMGGEGESAAITFGPDQKDDATDVWVINADQATDDLFFYNNGSTRVVILDGGNVGIGILTPGSLLEVHSTVEAILEISGNTDATLLIKADDDTGGTEDGSIQFFESGTARFNLVDDRSQGFFTLSTGPIASVFDVMKWDQQGRVMIGTGTPSTFVATNSGVLLLFNPDGNNFMSIIGGDGNAVGIDFKDANDGTTRAGGIRYELGNDSMDFFTNNAQVFTALTSGNFGIGVVAPVSKLDVEGNVSIGAAFSGTTAAPTNGLIVEGSVGVGTTTPTSIFVANQGTADGIIFELQSNDIDHGFSGFENRTAFFGIGKFDPNGGGALMTGYSDSASVGGAYVGGAIYSTNPDDGQAATVFFAAKDDGANGFGNLGADETKYGFGNATGGSYTLAIMGDGDVVVGTPIVAPAGPFQVVSPAAQTISAGNTIAADACGTVKKISAASAVTTATDNTFTAPAAANTDCIMDVLNVGQFTITLDQNANFETISAADIVLQSSASVRVVSDGTDWRQVGKEASERHMQKSETCSSATPNVIGEFCIDSAETSSPLHVATSAVVGGFVSVVLSEVTEPFGGFHISTSATAETSIATAEVFVQVAGTNVGDNLNLFTHSAGVLTLTATETHEFQATCYISFIAATNNVILHFRIVKNNDPVESTAHSFPVKAGIAADVRNIAIGRDVTLSENDTIRVMGANITDTSNFTVEAMQCHLRGL